MPLLNIVVMLIVVGVGLYLINRFIPMPSSIEIDSECRGRCRRLHMAATSRLACGRMYRTSGSPDEGRPDHIRSIDLSWSVLTGRPRSAMARETQ